MNNDVTDEIARWVKEAHDAVAAITPDLNGELSDYDRGRRDAYLDTATVQQRYIDQDAEHAGDVR